ncbi:hypothetical protein K5549_006164, partial [Capra hircus]
MAVNKGPTLLDGDLPEQENVLQRVLQLPVVSGTCECFQKTYASTKEAHPLVASVCNAYEKGVQGASSLAAWSMEPVVRRLSTQFVAANELACRGLDHLEEKIPALQYPPEKIASELKDTISTRLRSARNSISVPIASTSDKVLGAALAGCELAWGMARDTAEYAANTRAGRLASGGADLALGGVEKMVEFFLPPANEESAPAAGLQDAQKPPKAKPSFVSRVGALANTLSRHTFQTTAQALKQGHALAMWIPGVAPLSSLAQWGAAAAGQVVSRRRSEVRVPWLHSLTATREEDHEEHTDTEGEETEEEEDSETEDSKLSEGAALPGPQGLLGSVAHTLQKALQSTVSVMMWAPAAVLGTAGRMLHLTPAQATSSTKGRAMSLSDALKGVTDNVVDTVVHYVPGGSRVRKLEGGCLPCLGGPHLHTGRGGRPRQVPLHPPSPSHSHLPPRALRSPAAACGALGARARRNAWTQPPCRAPPSLPCPARSPRAGSATASSGPASWSPSWAERSTASCARRA